MNDQESWRTKIQEHKFAVSPKMKPNQFLKEKKRKALLIEMKTLLELFNEQYSCLE